MRSKITTLFSWAVALGLLASTAMAQEKRQFPTNKPAGDLNVLTDQDKADGWELLFNGKDLTGWEADKEECWSVKDGIIVSEKGTTHLFSKEKFQNVELQWDVCAYDVAVPKQRFGNSGVFLRGIKEARPGAFPKGYEVQVDPYDVKNPTGGVYGKAPGNLLVDENGKWKPEAFFAVHEGKWMHQRARIEGNRIQVWINGEQTMDWTDPDNSFPEAGQISLQNHHATDVVLFANIKVKRIK